ncbi:hypothetical protein FRC08_017691 [Ceratobasidium sp. 394]|nr:hypothetical protein FRC08_017691 [Ceratobasidium sp. 394]
MSFVTSSLHPVNTSIPSLSGVLRVLAEKAKSTQPLDLQKILEQAASSVHAHESIVKMLRATSFPGRPNDSDDPAWVHKGYNKALSKLIQDVDNPPLGACAARVLFSNSLRRALSGLSEPSEPSEPVTLCSEPAQSPLRAIKGQCFWQKL